LLPAPVSRKRRNRATEAERFGVAMFRPDKNSRLSPVICAQYSIGAARLTAILCRWMK
jgi:hypothetical protein